MWFICVGRRRETKKPKEKILPARVSAALYFLKYKGDKEIKDYNKDYTKESALGVYLLLIISCIKENINCRAKSRHVFKLCLSL